MYENVTRPLLCSAAWRSVRPDRSYFRVQEEQSGYASLTPGDRSLLKPITEFGAKPYTEDEKRSLAEIIKAFNEKHGTQFTEADFIRYEQITQEMVNNEEMKEMLRNNPPDVVFNAFAETFFRAVIRAFQRDHEMRNIILTDPQARNQAIRHFFNRAVRLVREESTH